MTEAEIAEIFADRPLKTFRRRLGLPKRLNKQAIQEKDAPYLADLGDPGYKKIDRGKSIKVLTKTKPWPILVPVKQAKRKDDKMATDKKPKTNISHALKSVAWLVFAAQQAYAGYLVLAHFHGYIAVATGLVSLGIAIAVVIAHFVRAHR